MSQIFRFRLSEKKLRTFKISIKENKTQTQCRGSVIIIEIMNINIV
jgi:hypothetical protein